MSGYIGVSSKARNITDMYVGIGGVARKVTKAYIGVNGVARLFYEADDSGTTGYKLTYGSNVSSVKDLNGTVIVSGSTVAAGTSLKAIYGTTSTSSLATTSLEEEEISPQASYTYTLYGTNQSTNKKFSLATGSSATLSFTMPAYNCTLSIVRSTSSVVCEVICDSCLSNVCSSYTVVGV